MDKKIHIITYRPEYKADFIRLNKEWIERFFKIEEADLTTFEGIDDKILNNGGQIFLAVDEDGNAAGCCALVHHPEHNCHELAKMAVSPGCQGHGIGLSLGTALIDYARHNGAKRIFLEGNTRLAPSIRLYRKLGFKEVPLEGRRYERCDIQMELNL